MGSDGFRGAILPLGTIGTRRRLDTFDSLRRGTMSFVTTRDTAPEAQRAQASVFRAMSPHARLLATISMSEEAREITRDGIRFRHPTWPPARVERELLLRLYGAELMARAWGA